MNQKQLRELIVRPALKHIELWSPEAEELLIGTAAQESELGYYIKQINGPALGIFQMEPATYEDIWVNYLAFRRGRIKMFLKDLSSRESQYLTHPAAEEMIVSPRFAAAMARIHYRRVHGPLPPADDIGAMARYWKRYYNTEQGRGTEEEFKANYVRLVKRSPG